MTYDENVSQINLRAFQDALCLGLAAIMAGTGDLDVLRRLRRLHSRRHDEATYGGHMAVHMAIGLLFISGGQYTLRSSRLATAALFCSTYPKFPTTPGDNNFHLQALRHLWVLASERRCFIPRIVETFQATLVPIKVCLRSDAEKSSLDLVAPCLLPDLDNIASIETATSEFQKVILDFVARPSLLEQFRQNPMIFVIRNPIVAAFQTPFEQGLARLLEKESRAYSSGKSITASVQECLRMNYLEEDAGMTEEGRPVSDRPNGSCIGIWPFI
jgi:anaphase-promoting complex subunit 1